jgi:hypothetical protein
MMAVYVCGRLRGNVWRSAGSVGVEQVEEKPKNSGISNKKYKDVEMNGESL